MTAFSSGGCLDANSSSVAKMSSNRNVTASSMLLLSLADVPNLFQREGSGSTTVSKRVH